MRLFPFYFCILNDYFAATAAKQFGWIAAVPHIVLIFIASLHVFPRQPVRKDV